ncbi:SCP2 sterol-binding domain-containing protein [Phaeobacter sp. QD34_3]|uniref:SCP2 sterol-binding domain-containing protein n=1 Tax=unclassified Phaeobacter TaxID=2621772 RepID=UPI00237F1048|nr:MULTISPECIES: SCP2 sterol-binding domain-containing protein [unclassified Phaeobacter]MDE4133715.1 SCP2 sterol-binding domain-containing protein [Phaeobacter sp. QD34_3]MDE4137352.1 SCP2 sterol-binding domain-containing protein [Phaeobacter sp. QD34_24]MDE4176470.1 SCP2 sterol-binding domain-containing protein [Phaeobacter sp. PT47_59]
MSDTLTQAAEALNEKLEAGGFDGSAKFAIEDMGAIVLDSDGVRVSDEEADVTMSADAETFQAILSGELNPTAAFMSGKLTIDGDMGTAMKLASVLA